MKRHVISLDDGINAIHSSKIDIAGSFGKGSHKKLQARIILTDNDAEVFYDVYDHNSCVMTINSLQIAIDKYNELP